ncbi:MAG TPA: macro domain-containing protein [Gemmatimonadales bacterium]|nr:macro domain-containing protein [Gemmatimonadales bacterium]
MIRLVELPLADLAVDAVVRAADERLEAVGDSSSALDECAGERFLEQRRVQAPLDIGAAVITGAGGLAAEFVLHIVVQGEDRPVTRDTVRKALISAWHRAEGWQLTTVAAPLAGLAGTALSIEEAALALVETFRDRPSSTGFPAELQVVVRNDDERSAVTAFLGNHA